MDLVLSYFLSMVIDKTGLLPRQTALGPQTLSSPHVPGSLCGNFNGWQRRWFAFIYNGKHTTTSLVCGYNVWLPEIMDTCQPAIK